MALLLLLLLLLLLASLEEGTAAGLAFSSSPKSSGQSTAHFFFRRVVAPPLPAPPRSTWPLFEAEEEVPERGGGLAGMRKGTGLVIMLTLSSGRPAVWIGLCTSIASPPFLEAEEDDEEDEVD